MNTTSVSTFAELHASLAPYSRDMRWIFRGHSRQEWKLVPKYGRPPYLGANERSFFDSWKGRAIEFIAARPTSDWEWLAIAQHHGLATRLLDWTSNPLAAAFFAVEVDDDKDAVVYAFRSRYSVSIEESEPFNIDGVLVLKPYGVAARIPRQAGIFTVHGHPDRPMEDLYGESDDINRIVISSTYRRTLKFELSRYGVNRATLFPDLDGLSQHVNWHIENRHFWRSPISLEQDI